VATRVLGKREQKRIVAALLFAARKIEANLAAGKQTGSVNRPKRKEAKAALQRHINEVD
jgi:hypothetical protein